MELRHYFSIDIFRSFKRIVCHISLTMVTVLLVCCNNNDKNDVTIEVDPMITETALPPGKQALEDEVNVVSPVHTETGMLGSNEGNGDKTGLSKVNLSDPELLKRKFKSLLMFYADDTMQVNQSRLATLILSKDELFGKIKDAVLEESNSVKEGATRIDTLVELGSKMRARLIPFGNSGLENCFTIEALGDDIQSFKTDRKKIIWQWKITPLKPGNQELKLSIQIIEKDGEAVSLPARNINVMILVKPESTMRSIGNFFEKYWQFLLTAILIPIITAWVSNVVKNRQPKRSSHKEPPATGPSNNNADKPHSTY